MTVNHDLERRVTDFYELEAPSRAPDWVLRAVLTSIDTTPQRRAPIRVPWRFPVMNTYAKVAIAAVVVVALGAIGVALLRPGTAPFVAAPDSPSPSLSPDPSAPPPLSETFTSTIHGVSISYPTGWTATPATERWLSPDQVNMGPAMDHVWHPTLGDHLGVNFASQPLDGKTGEAWATEFLGHPDWVEACGSGPAPITIDGASGLLCRGMAAIWSGDRGYVFWFYRSVDEPWTARYYDEAWNRSVLDTAQFRPDIAVDDAIALTETFTSNLHGISVSYPTGWDATPATVPWTDGMPNAEEGARDTIDDGQGGNRFIGIASQPLDGKSGQAWADTVLADPTFDQSCTSDIQPSTIDGAQGQIAAMCPDGMLTAQVWTADRGYWIVLFGSQDRALFEDILSTVKLLPEDAVAAPSPSP